MDDNQENNNLQQGNITRTPTPATYVSGAVSSSDTASSSGYATESLAPAPTSAPVVTAPATVNGHQ